jgi:hypothetical protein
MLYLITDIEQQEALRRTNSPTFLHKPTANNLVFTITMEHNPNPLLSKAHLTNSNFSNYKMIEVMGLKIIAPRSP